MARGEWDWQGYITSDCQAEDDVFNAHHYTTTPEAHDPLTSKNPTPSNLDGHTLITYTLYPDNLHVLHVQQAAAAKILQAGTDINCGGFMAAHITTAVQKGLANEVVPNPNPK